MRVIFSAILLGLLQAEETVKELKASVAVLEKARKEADKSASDAVKKAEAAAKEVRMHAKTTPIFCLGMPRDHVTRSRTLTWRY